MPTSSRVPNSQPSLNFTRLSTYGLAVATLLIGIFKAYSGDWWGAFAFFPLTVVYAQFVALRRSFIRYGFSAAVLHYAERVMAGERDDPFGDTHSDEFFKRLDLR